MLLGQAAWLDGNQLNVIGAGWSVRPPEAIPMGVGVVIYFPRDQSGTHSARLELLYANGEAVLFEGPEGATPLVYETQLNVQGLNDPSLQTPLDTGFVLNLAPHPLARGREYVWRLQIDGRSRPGWTLPFRTTPPNPA
jgi:hypothetical protein